MSRAPAGIATLVLAGIGLACFSDRPTPTATESVDCAINLSAAAAAAGAGGASDSVAVIAIKDFAFLPDTVRIPPGGRVVWVNCEPPTADQHTTTADGGAWDSGFLASGDVYALAFPESGDFPYHCIPHPFMTGAVIVEP